MTGDIICNMILPILSIEELQSLRLNNEPLYDLKRLSITFVTYVFLLLTFGLAYPPLAVLLLISVTLQTLALQMCVHSHYQQVVNDQELYKLWNEILDLEMNQFNLTSFGSTVSAFILSSVFIGFFIIDMTFNSSSSSVLVIVLPILLVSCTIMMLICYRVISTSIASQMSNATSAVSIELTNATNIRENARLQVVETDDTNCVNNPIRNSH